MDSDKRYGIIELMESDPEQYSFIEAAMELDVTPVEALDMLDLFRHEDVFAYLDLRTMFDEEASL